MFSVHNCSVSVIWRVLHRYHWQSFISSAVFGGVLQEKKKKGVEGEGCRALARGWAFAALAGKLGVWAGETGADHGLVASFCIILSSAGHLKNSREQTHFTSGL